MNVLMYLLNDAASVSPWLSDQSMWIIGGLVVALCGVIVYLFNQIDKKIDGTNIKIDCVDSKFERLNTKLNDFTLQNTKEHGEVCGRLDLIESHQQYFMEKVKEVELEIKQVDEQLRVYNSSDDAA